MFNVIVKTGYQISKIIAEKDQNLMKLLSDNRILLETPCNGKGTCGKCHVKILSGYLPTGNQDELTVLGTKRIGEGYRLSCSYKIQSDLEIEIKDNSLQVTIVTEGVEREVQLAPIVTKQTVILEKPGLASQSADYQRVLNYALCQEEVDLKLIRQLPEILRKKDFTVTLVKEMAHRTSPVPTGIVMVMDAATLFTGTDVRTIGPALAVRDMADGRCLSR